MSRLATLPGQWRDFAAQLRAVAAEGQARALEQAAQQLETALTAEQNEVLTLAEAAVRSGLSQDHLRRLVAQGAIPQAGRKGAPRIRTGDLPRKPRAAAGQGSAGGYDLDADARALLGKLRAF